MVREIPLTQGQVALVDNEDYERVSKFNWYALWTPNTKSFRATRRSNIDERESGRKSAIYMHRVIMNAPPEMEVDHINHDTLNNQKSNLRLCTRTENNRNQRKLSGNFSSQYKGVSWHQLAQKWRVQIQDNNKRRHLGLFTDETDAARVYNKAAREMFGEYAVLNRVPDAR